MSSEKTSLPPAFNPTFLIVTLGLLTAFGPLSIDMYLPAFDVMAKELHTPLSKIQTTLSVFFIGMALGQLVYGPLSDHLGRKRPLIGGLILYILASFICLFAPNAELLIGARLIQALGGCAGIVMARAIARDCFPPQEMARVMSLLMLVMGLAPVLAPFAGGLMIEYLPLAWGWRAIFASFAFLGILSLGMAFWGLPETLAPSERSADLSIKEILETYFNLLKTPVFIWPALSGSMGLACLFVYITGSSALFLNHLNLSPLVYSLIFASNAIGIIGGAQVNRYLLRRYTLIHILQFAFGALLISSLILTAVLAFTLSPWLIVPSLWMALASLGFIMPNSTALALAEQKKQAGSASAVLGMLQYMIGALGAGLITYAINQWQGNVLAIGLLMSGFGLLGAISHQKSKRV